MSKLDKLVGKGKEIEIGGIHIDIKPLTVSSLPLLMQVGDESNKEIQAKAMSEIITLTLKDSVSDATDEEINKISLEHLTKLMEAIMEVNQLEGIDSKKSEFFENIKKRQKDAGIGKTGNKKANE